MSQARYAGLTLFILVALTCVPLTILLCAQSGELVSESLWRGQGGTNRINADAAILDGAGDRNNFSWVTHPPSEKLVWCDCYAEHQCARLIVPLNYSDPDGEKAIIALTRIPSPLPTNSPWYRGPILFNPGGPGGSGVDLIVRTGRLLATIVGPQFDIVGFDPRGVGRSLPHVSFFETPLERVLWGTEAIGVINKTSGDVARQWARSKIQNQLADERQRQILDHINTDQTARDMLRITEAHGKEKIQYWGFSYGSILGATFAAMFPEKVERLVIDGVADAEDYFATLWSKNLLDTDKTMQAFFDGCVAAGPEGCPFYAPTSEDISRNLSVLYETVKAQPVPVRTPSSYGLMDYNRLKSTIFSSLYKPYATFLPLAHGLADLSAGDATALYDLSEGPIFKCSCDDSSSDIGVVRDAQAAIMCTDGDPVPGTLEEFQKYFDEMTSTSTWSEVWVGIRAQCIGWPQTRKTHFQGPFVGNTSFPILLVGNTADPVTPLWAAKKMAKGFPHSSLLTQDSPGHCSLAAPSLCTQKHIRDYFVDGTLPDPGTVCPVIGSPFPGARDWEATEDQAVMHGSLTADDKEILDAVRALSKSFKLSMPL